VEGRERNIFMADTKKIKLNVSGMHCASCALSNEKVLAKLKGVNRHWLNMTKNKFL